MEEFNYFRHWDDFMKQRLVIKANNDEQWKKLMVFLKSQGFKWNGGQQLINDNGNPNIKIESYPCVTASDPRNKRLMRGYESSYHNKIKVEFKDWE